MRWRTGLIVESPQAATAGTPLVLRLTGHGHIDISDIGQVELAVALLRALDNLPQNVSDIWLKQITNKAGFKIIYVAAIHSVGVPARLNSNCNAEFWDGNQWQPAPPTSVVSWL